MQFALDLYAYTSMYAQRRI